MKTLNEILDNYKDYAVVLDDRFGSRLAKFLTEEQLEKIGFKYGWENPIGDDNGDEEFYNE